MEWLKTMERHRISGCSSYQSMNQHQRLQGLACKNSKYETDSLHCLQINQPLVYSLARPRLSMSFSNIVSILSQLITAWIPCLLLCFYLQVYELQTYECLSFLRNSQISFVKWWHMSAWEVPILLMHPIAVALSENTLIWTFSSFMKDFKPRSMAFSLSAFMWNCFSLEARAPLLTYHHMNPPNQYLRHQCIWL